MANVKFGWKPSDPVKLANSIKLARILKPTLEVVPTSDNNFNDFLPGASWPVLLNAGPNGIGDCVVVGIAHSQRLYRKALANVDAEWNETQVRQFYATQNPNGQDNGMDIQTALSELLHNGGPDGVKLLAYASVDVTNPAEVYAATHIFGCALTGFNVQSHNETEFNQGKDWTWQNLDYIVGGHCTILGAYEPRYYGAITWGAYYRMTDNFWAKAMQELWIPIWPWIVGTVRFAANIDYAALQAEFASVTNGGVLPDQPAPIPTPTPTPAPGCLVGSSIISAIKDAFKGHK